MQGVATSMLNEALWSQADPCPRGGFQFRGGFRTVRVKSLQGLGLRVLRLMGLDF
jgi:hypothetical protein